MIDIENLVPEEPTFGVLDIITAFEPPSQTISVAIPGLGDFLFKAMSSRDDLIRLKRGAERFAKVNAKAFPDPEMRALHDVDISTLTTAYMLAEMSVKPKLSVADFLRVAQRAPVGFEYLLGEVNKGLTNITATIEAAMLAEAKKDWSETQDGALAAKSAGSTGESTLTNSQESHSPNT